MCICTFLLWLLLKKKNKEEKNQAYKKKSILPSLKQLSQIKEFLLEESIPINSKEILTALFTFSLC